MSFDGDSLFGVGLPLDTWFDDDGLGAPLAFPLSLAWESLWRASWTLPWLGEATAGSSLGRDLYEPTNFPGSGASQNGYTPAAFDGVNDSLTASGAAEDYFGTTAWTVHAVLRCNSLVAPGGFTADQPALLSVGPGSSAVAIAFDSTGVTALQYDGIGGTAETPRIAVGTSAYRRIQARWTGTQLQCRVDGGAWSSVSCTSQVAYSGTGEIVRVGVNYDGTKFLDHDLLELGAFSTSLSDTDLDALDAYAVIRYGLASGFVLQMVGLPARARAGVGALSLGGLTVASKGLRTSARGGISQLAAASLALSGVGLPPVRRGGVSSLSTSLTLAAKGLPALSRAGVSSLSLGVLSLAGLGLRTRTTVGSSAVSLGGLTLVSKGLPTSSSSGVSALSPGSLAFVGVGVPTATRGGVSTLTLGVSTTALFSVGLPSQLRAGVSTLTLGPVAMAGQGLPASTRGGSSTSTPGALTVASKGLPTRSTGGAGVLSSFLTLSGRGLPASSRGGASAFSSSLALSGVGLPTATRGGVSSLSPGPLTLAGKGLPAQLRAGAAASLPVFVVAGRGLPARARAGASALALGPVTLAGVGFPASTRVGVSSASPGPVTLVSLGLPARIRAGVGLLAVRAENQAADLALEAAPFVCIGLELAPFATLELPVSPFVVLGIEAAPLADLALEHAPVALVTIQPEHQMQKPYRYDVGDDAVFLATFTLTETGELADPTTLEVTVRPPTSTAFVVTYPSPALERKSLGVYRLAVDCTEVGVWEVYWRSTGAAKAAEKASWTVQ